MAQTKYEVTTVSGVVLGIRDTREEAIALARVHDLSEARVFAVRPADGLWSLAVGILALVAWVLVIAMTFLSPAIGDLGMLVTQPVAFLFFLFGAPIVGIVTIYRGVKEIRRTDSSAGQ